MRSAEYVAGRYMSSNRRPPPQSENVFTRALVDSQTTQLESIMLQQRLAEMRLQAQVISKRLQLLKKQADAQRQYLGKVTRFRAGEQASLDRKTQQRNLSNRIFREDVQNSFKMTDKDPRWQRVKRDMDKRHRMLDRLLRKKK